MWIYILLMMCLNGGWRDEGCGCFINLVWIFNFLVFKEGGGGEGIEGFGVVPFFFDNLICGGEDLNPRYVCWKHKKLYHFF